MWDIIISLLVAVAVGLAIAYIIREKKKGNRCIGCSYSGSCNSHTCKEDKNRHDNI